jgi:hypothetical protein
MMEDLVKLRQKYLRTIARIPPVGAVGLSVLLGATISSDAAERIAARRTVAGQTVSERLAAIREAVFAVAGSGLTRADRGSNIQLVWGNRWFNGGWNRRSGRPWGNWRNFSPPWGNFWRNRQAVTATAAERGIWCPS